MTVPASPAWRIEPLSSGHERESFSCGKPSLDEYLKQYAMQNQRKNVGRTFVAVRPGSAGILGYYTLSTASVAFANLPIEQRKGLPRYPVPVVHLGRLAVAREAQGQGLGRFLLVDALRRTQRVSSELGVCGIEVYALDHEAKAFYLKYGFIALADDKFHLYLPMTTIQQLVFPNA